MTESVWEVDGPLPPSLERLEGRALRAAIDHHRAVIQALPQDLDSYHLLHRLYLKSGEPDRAWCIAGLLCAFEKASPRELAFYEAHRHVGVIEPDRNLDGPLWRTHVLSEKEDTRLSRVFAIIYESCSDILPSQRLKDLGIKPDRDEFDLNQPLLVCRTITGASRVLGIPTPRVYLHREGHSLRVLPTSPPALALGPDMLKDIDETQLAFVIGKCLEYFHPWHVMAALYDYRQLELILMAAARVVSAGIERYEEGGNLFSRLPDQALVEVGKLEKEMARRMTEEQADTLAWLLRSYGRTGTEPNSMSWDDVVELSANHAGLVVADDIALVGSVLTGEVSVLSQLSRVGKVEDFVRYVAGDRFAELRKIMGVNVVVE